MKIYTRTGDDGTTGLVGGVRVSKSDALIEAIGTVDELNAALGFALAADPEPQTRSILCRAQNALFEIGAELATPPGSRFDNASLGVGEVEALEASIDFQTTALAPLKNFVLPGGSEAAARLHMARAVCRRAERSILAVPQVRPLVPMYLNRLSDWLFTAARTANATLNVEDVKWVSTRGN